MENINLKWTNINLKVNIKLRRSFFNKNKANIETKEILNDISGSAHPGQILAIMGETGSGKSSLLSILADRNPANSNDYKFGGIVEYFLI